LDQQLSHSAIKIIKERVEKYGQTENGSYGNIALEDFVKHSMSLTKNNNEAKDNVKYLTTLERQFKNLSSEEGLSTIEETLPSLMNGLQTMQTMARNYKNNDKMQDLISLITDEIADKVEASINISKLFDLSENAEDQLNNARGLMIQGKSILEKWENLFKQAKERMEK
jgi:dynein heavy chain